MFDLKSWTRPSEKEVQEILRANEIEAERIRLLEEERRRAERVTLHAAVTATSETNFFAGFSENLSEGGVFIASLSPPPVGTALDVAVAVGEDEAIMVKGEVSWIRTDDHGSPTGCGVRFTGLTERQSAYLHALLERAGREPLFFEV